MSIEIFAFTESFCHIRHSKRFQRVASCKEHRFILQTFGLPVSKLPVTEEGEPKNRAHRACVKCWQRLEENAVIDARIFVPNRLDVLLGRGKPIQEHFGNLRFHSLLDNHQRDYEQAKKFEKMQIAQKVACQVRNYSGRFLKQEGTTWVSVEDSVAREKVSHAFRTRRSTSATGEN